MFDATKAKQLTQKACGNGNPAFDEMMGRIEARITGAANSGKREIISPFKQTGFSPIVLSQDMKDSIKAELVKRGFTWTHHPAPTEPYDPREVEYDTISW